MAKLARLLAIPLIVALVLGACTPQTPQQSGPLTVVVAQAADPVTLDPQKPGGPVGGNFYRNLFDTLLKQDDTGKVVASIATEWSRLSETQWRFKLRQGVKFTNGEAVDANAVHFTIQRMLEPGKVRQLYTFGLIKETKVINDYTIDIITKVADPFLPIQVTDLFIIPPKAAAQAGEDGFNLSPIGSGPFKLGERLPNQRIVLEANKEYWGGAPKIDQLVFRPIPEASTRLAELLSGGVDIVPDLTPEQAAGLKPDGGVRAISLPSKRVPFVGINLLANAPSPLKDKRVRQALNYAVDAEVIIKSVLGGNGKRLATIFRPDWPGYDTSLAPYPYDPAKAKQLLADAGYPNGFSMTMMTSAGIISKGVEVTQAVAGQLAAVGVKVEVTTLELNAYRAIAIGGQKENKLSGLYLWNWGAKPGAPDSALNGFLRSTGITSYWNNPTFDALVDETLQTFDENKRLDGYKRVQSMLKDEAPVIFLYQANDIYGLGSRVTWKPRIDQDILGEEMAAKR